MHLTFLGAARDVTGSRYLLEACGKRALVDYGMEQGVNVYENMLLSVAASTAWITKALSIVTRTHMSCTGSPLGMTFDEIG